MDLSSTGFYGELEFEQLQSNVDLWVFPWRSGPRAPRAAEIVFPEIFQSYGIQNSAICRDTQGKPHVMGQFAGRLSISLSHSDSILVAALTVGREIGIDIERPKPRLNMDGIVSEFFTEPERALYFSANESDKAKCFYQLWTAKEAVIKALGYGLFGSLKDFDVSLDPGLTRLKDRTDLPDWSLSRPDVDPDFVCTLAVRGAPFQVRSGRRTIGIDQEVRA